MKTQTVEPKPEEIPNLQGYDNEKLIDAYNAFEQKKEEAEAAMQVIKDEFLDRIKTNKEYRNGIITKKYTITKVVKISFDVSIEQAETLGAIKIIPEKQEIDQAMLRNLDSKGAKIPGRKILEYPLIREIKKHD